MNKNELIEGIAKDTGFTKADAKLKLKDKVESFKHQQGALI